jgi:hypothetical protein
MLTDACFEPGRESACVQQARRNLCLNMKVSADAKLRAITFGTRTGSRYESWYCLRESPSRRPAGEVSHRIIRWGTTDPIQSYLVVRLRSGLVLEAVGSRAFPSALDLHLAGIAFANLNEEPRARPKSWFQRAFGGERRWDVYLQGEVLGSIDLKYPVSNRSRLFLKLPEGVTLPIGLGSVWGRTETKFVIPPDAPEVADYAMENLYFLVAVCFRVLIFQLDLS